MTKWAIRLWTNGRYVRAINRETPLFTIDQEEALQTDTLVQMQTILEIIASMKSGWQEDDFQLVQFQDGEQVYKEVEGDK